MSQPNATLTPYARGAGATPDWAHLRAEFPVVEKFAVFNGAEKAPISRVIEAAMRSWLDDAFQTGGQDAFSMAGTEETRSAVAAAFGMPTANTALIKNTSEGINIVAQGFPFEPGDNVVISSEEHENNTFPWRHAEARGISVRIATPDEDGRVTLERYLPLIDKRTRVLSAAWVSYGNGYRSDIARLSAFCSANDILLVVDGVQGVGVLADDIAYLGADVVVAGGHKAQFSLAGAGFLYASDRALACLRSPYAAKFSFTSNDRTQEHPTLAPSARRFEYGNPNFVGCWVQRRSAEFISSIGLAHIEARVKDLTTQLIEGAEKHQIAVRTPKPWAERAGIVSVAVGDAAAARARLRERGVLVSEKDGHVRASVHFYNSEADIERLIAELAAL